MNIVVYGKENCSWCKKACEWLDEKNLTYSYIDVLKDISLVELIQLKERYSMNTVPIVIIDKELVGGYAELVKIIYG